MAVQKNSKDRPKRGTPPVKVFLFKITRHDGPPPDCLFQIELRGDGFQSRALITQVQYEAMSQGQEEHQVDAATTYIVIDP